MNPLNFVAVILKVLLVNLLNVKKRFYISGCDQQPDTPARRPRNIGAPNSLSTNRPSFAAANQVVTPTRVTNERVAKLGRLVADQFSSVRVL